MKIKYWMVVLITTISCIINSSCNKFDDLNIDPTRSSSMDPKNQLLLAQLWFSGDLATQERTSYFMTMPMMQQLGGAYNMRTGFLYIKTNQVMWVLWENSYPHDVLNIVDAVNRTNGDATKTNLNAMCRIMKVYTFARLTDLYGDIPYFEAGKAFIDGVRKPKYDAQKDIYDDFLKELKEASEQLDPAKDPVTNEFYFQGNIARWKKFANSLRLRLAMRLGKRDPEKAKQHIQEAYNAGLMTSNADICLTKHENIPNQYGDMRGNSLSVAVNTKNQMPRICSTFLAHLQNTTDPRLNHLVRVYKENNIPVRFLEREDITAQVKAKVGLIGSNPGRYTYEDALANTTITSASGQTITVNNVDQKCQLNHVFFRNEAPYMHLTYSEVELLLADATVRFNLDLGGTAQEHYERGVRAAMQQLALFPSGPVVSATEIDNFLAANTLEAGRELEIINTQMWITLLLNGPENYANWRRSGFPLLAELPINPESSTRTTPRRFQYPLSEIEQNAENVQAAISIIGEDDWSKSVWWDMN